VKFLIFILIVFVILCIVNKFIGEEKEKPCECGSFDFKILNKTFVPMEECVSCSARREACF